jgi:hypothetical protein
LYAHYPEHLIGGSGKDGNLLTVSSRGPTSMTRLGKVVGSGIRQRAWLLHSSIHLEICLKLAGESVLSEGKRGLVKALQDLT